MAGITTNVLIGLVVGVGLILLYLGWLAARNPVLIKIGLRNIPRRPSQSILIVIGLTLSTIIIVSALSTGDTLTYSVRTNAVQAFGPIDEIVAPPLLSLFASLADSGSLDEAAAENQQAADLSRLMEGGLTSLLAVLEGGLPGITMDRLDQLKVEAKDEPLIDAVAGSIIFPTIIRNTATGQGEPFGFIFAVDDDYDQNFGLTATDGGPVSMEALEPGVGNIFAQAANLLTLAQQSAAGLGLQNFTLSNVAVATAGGVLFAKLLNRFSDNKINPLLGAAGVSAVPDSARVVQMMGHREDPHNHLLMHAMAPNVAGIIGSAIAAGALWSLMVK